MAILELDGDHLKLRMSRLERFGALHGDIRVRLDAVRAARSVPDPWHEMRGIRSPGTGLPGRIMLGTLRGSFGKDFAAVYRHRAAVVVDLEGQEFERLLVTVADAAAVSDMIEHAAGRGDEGAGPAGNAGANR